MFDLDNTLYPAPSDLFIQVNRRITRYIADLLALDFDEARLVQRRYFQLYGTSLAGLIRVHDIDPHAFLAHVHDIDFTLIGPDPAMIAAIDALPGRKIIYTNAAIDYAWRVLDRLGLAGRFEAVFDIVKAEFRPKPDRDAFDKLVTRYGLTPARCVMVEDIARNLAAAAERGMTTVWVPNGSHWSNEGHGEVRIDHVAPDLATWLGALVGSVDSRHANAIVRPEQSL